jgi:hypothetical protein
MSVMYVLLSLYQELTLRTWMELDDPYVLCTSPLIYRLVLPIHWHTLSFYNLPE